MNVVKALLTAVSMYSKIPVPYVAWDKKFLQYTLCFFPLVGVITGALMSGWWYFAGIAGIGTLAKVLAAAAVPLVVTGGIHMDGFMDTVDARSSYQPKEKKLEILKDPHLGAFAVIKTVIYFLLYIGALSELKGMEYCLVFGICFVISRCMSGLSFIFCKGAKTSGLFYEFASTVNKKAVGCTLVLLLIIIFCGIGFVNIWLSPALLMTALLTFWYYCRVSEKEFGGVTGDLAGYFLQWCELNLLLCIVVMEKIL